MEQKAEQSLDWFAFYCYYLGNYLASSIHIWRTKWTSLSKIEISLVLFY